MFATLSNVLIIFLAGAGTGVLGAMLGVGGGVFLIPILVLGLGIPMHYAVATSIVTVIATSTAVASINVERGIANMRLGMTLEIATALGAITGGLTAAWLSAATLEGLFAVVLIPTAVAMWRGKSMEAPSAAAPSAEPNSRPATATADTASAAPPAVLGGRYFDEAEQRDVTYRVERLWAGMVIAFVAGNLSGLLGIGGGVFKVPALHLLCAVPIKAAAATSNFMIGVTAAASAFLYYGRGEVRPAVTAAAVLGVVAGSGLGLLVNRRVRADAVRRLFALLLLAVAGQMLFRAFSLRI